MANTPKIYRDLIVWQRAVQLVTHLYQASKTWPREETYGLTSQIRRCSVSIPSNIAEGFARRSQGDYLRFLNIAMGSLFELQTQLEIAKNLGFVDLMKFEELFQISREIEAMLAKLIQRVGASDKTSWPFTS